ncbi:MAG: hypothetical protein GDA67_03120 [Nitrospira sp. CR1.3]|nr:hypothetical protein [Nitrospira sp. CR1.3]
MNRRVGAVCSTIRSQLSKEWTVYALLSLLVAALWITRLQGPIDLRWDGGVYYVLGTSLAEGKGYRLLNEPGEIEAVQYPPLFPLIVSAHQWILGSDNPLVVGQWLRIFSCVVFSLYAAAVFRVLQCCLSQAMALVGTTICLFQMSTYFLSDLLFPELLYGLITTVFILYAHQRERRDGIVGAALLASAAFGLKTVGIALFAAWVTEELLNKNVKQFIVRCAIVAIPVLCWQMYLASVISGSEYLQPAYDYQRAPYMFYNVSYVNNVFTFKDPFRPELGLTSTQDMATRLVTNLGHLPESIGESVSAPRTFYELPWKMVRMPFPIATTWPVDVALFILSGLVLGGIGLHLRDRQWITPLYVIFYLGALCLTPWPEQIGRYLMPLIPFLVVFLLTTLSALSTLPGRWRQVTSVSKWLVVVLILVLQGSTYWGVQTWGHPLVTHMDLNGAPVRYRLFFYRDAHRALDAGLDWVQEHAKSTDVLAGSMPHWMYLRTKLKAVMPPFESDPAKAQALLDSVPVTYLFLDEGLAVDTKQYTASVVRLYSDRWERVYVDSIAPERPGDPPGQFEIYRRLQPTDVFSTGVTNRPADIHAHP